MEEKNYLIQLWRGAGYWLNDSVIVKSFSIDEALVIASIEDKNACIIEDNDPRYKEIEEDSDIWLYLDRSAYNLNNCYLLIENASIKEIEPTYKDIQEEQQ